MARLPDKVICCTGCHNIAMYHAHSADITVVINGSLVSPNYEHAGMYCTHCETFFAGIHDAYIMPRKKYLRRVAKDYLVSLRHPGSLPPNILRTILSRGNL